MPEETPQVKNKGLLLVAIVLAIVVVMIYNFHVSRIRSSLQGEQLKLLQFTRSMQAGEKITKKDIQGVFVRKDTVEQLGTVVQAKSESYLLGRKIRENVNPEQWVQWSYVQGGKSGDNVESRLEPGEVGITIELDNRAPIGALCRPGTRVNLIAYLHVPDMPPRFVRVIRNVKVLATGMVAIEGPSGFEVGRRKTTRTYRTIGLAVKRDVSPILNNIFNYAEGKVRVEVLPQATLFDPKTDGIINPDEKDVLDKLLMMGGMVKGSS
jgi:Flp pilus assembly protein CpaB